MRVPVRRTIFILVGLGILLAAGFAAWQWVGLPSPQLDGTKAGLSVDAGGYGPFSLTFAFPVQPQSLEGRLTLTVEGEASAAAVDGRLSWPGTGRRVVIFTPNRPLDPWKHYTLRLMAGVQADLGLILRQGSVWTIRVRPAEVLLLSPSQAPELWRIAADGRTRARLTSTGGKVFDFSAVKDGSHIVYSAGNALGGKDLWEISRLGDGNHRLLDCGADWCIEPVFAPDQARIVYTRRQFSGLPGSQPGIPHLWVFNLADGSTDTLIGDASITGDSPSWSPDGRYLAFVDEGSGGIRVLDWQAKSNFLIPADMTAGIAWAPDGLYLLYASAENAEELPYGVVYQVNVQTRRSDPLLGSDGGDAMDYSVPDVAPDGVWLAVARRLVAGNPSKQLWLMRSDGTKESLITDDPLSNHAGARWDFTGTRLVFQRLAIAASNSLPQVAVWTRSDGQIITLSEDAFQPRWIP